MLTIFFFRFLYYHQNRYLFHIFININILIINIYSNFVGHEKYFIPDYYYYNYYYSKHKYYYYCLYYYSNYFIFKMNHSVSIYF